MSLLSWLGRKIKLTDGKFWSAYFGGENWAGEPVTADTAMQVSAFWGCVRLIAKTQSTLPIGLYEPGTRGRKSRSDHSLYRLLHEQPNAEQTACRFWEGLIAWTLVGGTGYAPKAYRGRELIALNPPLNPHFMTPDRDSRGRLIFKYRDPENKNQERTYYEEELFVLPGFGFGAPTGLSPLQYARQSLSSARATERAAASHFANGMRPSGWLVYKGGDVLQPDQREFAKQNIINPMMGAENWGKIGILEGDFDYRQMTIAPEEAQMLESRRFSVEDVCRWHGVPPILIGHASQGQTMWGSGVEQIMLGWYTLSLRSDLVRIEQEVKRQLMTPEEKRSGLYAEHAVEGLLRADSAARGEFYWKLIQMGVVNPNWIADKENVPHSPGGDRYYLNTTLAPLDDDGLVVKAEPPPSPDPDSEPAQPPQRQPPRLEVV